MNILYHHIRVLALAVFLAAVVLTVPLTLSLSSAEDQSGSGNTVQASPVFLPVWKLMNREQKLQFLAGYLQGWRDAAHITGITTSFLREDPQSAAAVLDDLKAIYDLTVLRPDTLADSVDTFYSNPENTNAPLSKAVSAAKNEIR